MKVLKVEPPEPIEDLHMGKWFSEKLMDTLLEKHIEKLDEQVENEVNDLLMEKQGDLEDLENDNLLDK